MSIVKPTIVEKWQKKNKYGRPGTTLVTKKIAIHYTGEADVPGYKTVSYFNNVVANGCIVSGKYVYASCIKLNAFLRSLKYRICPFLKNISACNSLFSLISWEKCVSNSFIIHFAVFNFRLSISSEIIPSKIPLTPKVMLWFPFCIYDKISVKLSRILSFFLDKSLIFKDISSFKIDISVLFGILFF